MYETENLSSIEFFEALTLGEIRWKRPKSYGDNDDGSDDIGNGAEQKGIQTNTADDGDTKQPQHPSQAPQQSNKTQRQPKKQRQKKALKDYRTKIRELDRAGQ